ncbi:hypothetical protein H6P87_01308 [Rickettsia tillamookensis]|uniref:Uncharacterized protein n=1 Tax=Rickettsia tillamookensis TaxID=2761623 RepID=A0A9E6MJC6_9RICK|nr:hypothetical protein [Rickettsia tillamookensis]QQV75743.1 hypothetical protein H6P87_01308 [Rickettsia tillamookensis]
MLVVQELLAMETGQQELFIKNEWKLKSLVDIGVSVQELLAIEPNQQKLVIENSSDIAPLLKAGVAIDQLLHVKTETNQQELETTEFGNVDHNVSEVDVIGHTTEQA